TISHQQGDLAIELAWCVDADAAVRQVTLRVHNTGNRSAALRWVSVTEWLLGAQRSDRATVHTRRNRQRLRQPMADTGHSSGTRERDARDSSEGGPWLTTLLATQADHAGGFGQATAFGLGSGIGWLLAIVGIAAIREHMSYSKVPKPLRGLGISFIVTGLMGMAFMGFMGIKF
ncbi:MAG TPA: Rnf-Nqr domain containing protein, partial [Bacteroidales bacterium]|nr:Rnf-Nqr domain containing protein [Bacteroidales bacterium]